MEIPRDEALHVFWHCQEIARIHTVTKSPGGLIHISFPASVHQGVVHLKHLAKDDLPFVLGDVHLRLCPYPVARN